MPVDERWPWDRTSAPGLPEPDNGLAGRPTGTRHNVCLAYHEDGSVYEFTPPAAPKQTAVRSWVREATPAPIMYPYRVDRHGTVSHRATLPYRSTGRRAPTTQHPDAIADRVLTTLALSIAGAIGISFVLALLLLAHAR